MLAEQKGLDSSRRPLSLFPRSPGVRAVAAGPGGFCFIIVALARKDVTHLKMVLRLGMFPRIYTNTLYTTNLVVFLTAFSLHHSLLSFCNISHSKNYSRYDRKMYIGLYVMYPLFLPDFNKNLSLSTDFRTILKYQVL